MKFTKLLEPFNIDDLHISNRMVMPAMHLGAAENGFVTDRIIEFYRRRAQGGIGLIIVGGIGVSSRASGVPLMLSLKDDSYIPKLNQLVEKVHREKTKIAAQLYHAGAYAFSQIIGEQAVSSSDKYSNFTHQTPRALSTEEVSTVIDTIVAAGKRAEKAGFDAIEILSSAGYLIDQFLSPLKNDRTDRYGGSRLEDRMTFPLELIRKLKKEMDPTVKLGCRLSGDDFVPGSNTYQEKKIIAQAYEQAGIQYLNITGGWHETRVPQLPMDAPSGAFAYLGKEIRSQVKIPVFVSNRINDPILAENLLRDFYADAICFGRPMIADPDLPYKIQTNDLPSLRHCVGCNQGCFDGIFQMQSLSCMVNPLAMNEIKYADPKKAKKKKKILIIGAGPAGLEAARKLTLFGHDVSIYEKASQIGGQINVAWVPPGREDLKNIIDYYDHQIEKLHIPLYLNSTLTPKDIIDLSPDLVLCGSGVNFNIPPVPGFDGSLNSDVCFADEALAEDHLIGKKVVVIGGAATGVETALWAVKKGAMDPRIAQFLSFYDALPISDAMKRTYRGDRDVTLIEYLPKIGNSIGKSTKWVFLDELKKLGVKVITNAEILKIENDSLTYRFRDEESQNDNDLSVISNINSFILATGVMSNRDFGDKYKDYVQTENIANPPSIKYIGDAKKVGTILDAIQSGFKVAHKIGKI